MRCGKTPLFDLSFFSASYDAMMHWLNVNVLAINTVIQLCAVAVVFLVASFAARRPRMALEAHIEKRRSRYIQWHLNKATLVNLVFPFIALILQLFLMLVTAAMGFTTNVIEIICKLLTAWVVIRLTSSFLRYAEWSRYIAIMAWSVAALSITGLLSPTVQLLDSIALQAGNLRISILTVITGIITLCGLLWLSSTVASTLERRIHRLPNLTPSVRVLLSKVTKVSLIVIAILVGLNSIGIDLTALTVFGGAIGLGLGFGLQKVVSNLFSGIILLLDRSIKPGDVIEVGDTYGWVNSLSARHVSVLTRDGVEHLIPNEHLITEKVTNWSYSNKNVRLKIPFGISYDSDVHKAIELVLEAARAQERVLENPAPVCRLVGFGDNAIDLELRLWIDDPIEGVVNIRSDILLAVLDKFRASNISIPYPQRDLHIKLSDELEALLNRQKA